MNELDQLLEQIIHLNAIGNYRRVVNSLSPTIFKKYQNARLYYEAGLANELGGISYSRALERYSQAIDIDSEYQDAIYSRGKLYVKEKQFNHAAQDFDRLISLNPLEHTFHQSRGEVYLSTGDYEKAIACFTRAIELKPGSEDAWTYRGLAWLEFNEPEKSVEDETKVLSLNPNFMMAYHRRGRAFSKLSRHEKAIEDFSQAIKLDPGYLQNYVYRAAAWESINNYAKAIEDYSKAIRFDAENAEVYFKRAEIYFKMGEYEKAVTDYNASTWIKNSDEAEERMLKATAELEKQNSEEHFADKERIRKKAASFIDKIRVEYGRRFIKAKDGFRCGQKPEWDFELNRPKTADLVGWLPEIMPDIAKWDVVRSTHRDEVLVDTLTPIGELFYPHLVGIPIKEELWDAINEPFDQYKVDERMLGRVQKFESVGKLLERLARNIRLGNLDDHLVMEYYYPSIPQERIYLAYRKGQALNKRLFRN